MAPTLTQTLEWIDQSTDGHIPKNKASRRKIRRQAMRGIGAARKQDGTYGKVNLRQLPILMEEAVDNSVSTISELSRSSLSSNNQFQKETRTHEQNQSDQSYSTWSLHEQIYSTLPPPPSSKGYELARIQYGVDLPQLSLLTKIHFGRTAYRLLAKQPSMLWEMFRLDDWSYLGHVPQLYDQSNLIQDVTNCALARAQHSLGIDPMKPSPTVLRLYGKALASLQHALDDPSRLRDPLLLCATQIMELFELLNFSEDGAWIRHAAGATRLIEFRGPSGYSSEFEKALLMAHAGPLFSEALLNNEACFMEKPEWQHIFRSVALEGPIFCDRGSGSVALWGLKYHVPGLLRRTTKLVCSEEKPEMSAVDCLLLEVRELRDRIQEWRYLYDGIVGHCLKCSITVSELSKTRAVLAICVTDILLMNRCMLALDPAANWELEDQAQALAQFLVALEHEAAFTGFTAVLIISQKLGLAQAVVATEKDWRRARWQKSEGLGGRRVIERRVFERWCSLMGRKVD